ncbi:MAG: hypothetical protein ACJZ87_00875 [Paracoccaceae bacterium]
MTKYAQFCCVLFKVNSNFFIPAPGIFYDCREGLNYLKGDKLRYKVLLIGSCCLASISVSSQAADYTVNSAVTSRNGGSTINGDDTLTVTTSGSITVSSDNGIKTTGNGNTVIVHGSIEASANQRRGIRNLGSDNTTTLNGSITTSGSGGHGISNLAITIQQL